MSSEGVRNKLKIESKRRREAERALTEKELELRSKNVLIRKLERNDLSLLKHADSGILTETVNNTSKAFTDRDLEAVTDELISTQEKLAKAEEQLLRSQTLVQDLERNIQNIDNDVASLSGDDKELLRELDEIRAEIDATRADDSKSRSIGTEEIKDTKIKDKIQLEESREENTHLREEIACLRNILYDQGSSKTAVDEKVEKSAGIEMLSVRKQMEESMNENLALQEKIRKLEMLGAAQGEGDMNIVEKLRETEIMLEKSQEECSEMRNEVLALSEDLYEAHKMREKPTFDLAGLQRQDNELLAARNELVDKNREISTLETSLKSTQKEVRVLSKEISTMSIAFGKTQKEYNSVVEELQQTESALATVKFSKENQETKLRRLELAAEKAPQKAVELKVLRSQFKKLAEKNEKLTQQVKDVMGEVASMSDKHERNCAESDARLASAKELQSDIVKIVSETRERNSEVEDLTVRMENRMGMTEKTVEALDSEIAVAMRTLDSAQASLSERKEDPPMVVVPTQSESETILTEEKSEEGVYVGDVHEEEEEEAEEAPEEVSKPDPEAEQETEEEEEEVKEEEEKEALESRESVLERTRRLLDAAGSVQKLALKSKSLREGRLTKDDEHTMSNISLHDRKHTKYEELMKKVADSETKASNEIREVEARADDIVDVRE